MPSRNSLEERVIQPSPSISKKETVVLPLNIVKKPQDLEENIQHRDCSSLGRVFRDIRQWELNRLQKRKQKDGIGLVAVVLFICGMVGIYLGAWMVSALFFVCGAVAAGYLPMISSPRPPATLRFLPNRASPRAYSPQAEPLQSPILSMVVDVKASGPEVGDSQRVKAGLAAQPLSNSQPVDNFAVPTLRFSSATESKVDTFDIVAQDKLCPIAENDILCRPKI